MAKSKQEIIGYCLKCREKRVMSSTSAEFNRRGSPITRGVCSVCGTRMALTGRTKAHEGLEKPKPKSKPKRGNLVIVESPTKARTIRRILGKDYRVLASYGHVRDLLRSRLSVDIENDFTPEYRVPNEKRKVIKTLKQAVEESELVFLATDLDREGEAIAWHIAQATGLEPERTKRVVFHEVTQDAIRSAFANPSEMNDSLIDSQQARRIVDRLVGYQISPILWEKVRNRITAGRVQTVAVRMVVEREREIEAFVPQEYWTIEVELNRELPADEPNPSFRAKLHRIRGEKPDLTGQDQVDPIVAYLKTAQYQVEDVRLGKRRRNPTPPFITSTLQQTAFGRLGFRARRTMRTAQQLYEGVEINGQSHGLITYMRTDSVYSAPSAVQLARKWVKSNFSDDYLPKKPRFFRAKARLAQEAHEAIRPTMVSRTPDSIKHALSSDQYKLYDLIWRRFVSSQMAAAVYSTQSIDISATAPGSSEKPYLFRATGSRLIFPGFLAVMRSGDKEEDKELPELVVKEILRLLQLFPEQHFTEPPPRFTEASLIKAMEEEGIGRPSTYASILSTIQQRGYVETKGRALKPTAIGIQVNDLLVEYFPDVFSLGFTQQMENNLDAVAVGDSPWVKTVREFYQPFAVKLEVAKREMPNVKAPDEPVGKICPECGEQLIYKWGRFGKFIACSNYPTCRHTEAVVSSTGVKCPRPDCDGDLVKRRTRKGRTFYGCSNYPKCDLSTWKRPLRHKCPSCGGLLVAQRKGIAKCVECKLEHDRSKLK